MAFPDDISKIDTNLSPEELRQIVNAIENEKVEWVKSNDPTTSGAFGEVAIIRSGVFVYKGQKFELEEWNELVTEIRCLA